MADATSSARAAAGAQRAAPSCRRIGAAGVFKPGRVAPASEGGYFPFLYDFNEHPRALVDATRGTSCARQRCGRARGHFEATRAGDEPIAPRLPAGDGGDDEALHPEQPHHGEG